MAISLGDIKKKKIKVSPIENNNKTYNPAPLVNNQSFNKSNERRTYNLAEIKNNNITVKPISKIKSKVMTPSPAETMTINSINSKFNENISKNIVNGGIENEIHNMNMKNIGKTSLDKNIDLSGKSVMGKTTPVSEEGIERTQNELMTKKELREKKKDLEKQIRDYDRKEKVQWWTDGIGLDNNIKNIGYKLFAENQNTKYKEDKEYDKLVKRKDMVQEELDNRFVDEQSQNMSTINKIEYTFNGNTERSLRGIESTIAKITGQDVPEVKDSYNMRLADEARRQSSGAEGVGLDVLGSYARMLPQMIITGGTGSETAGLAVGFANYGGDAYNEAKKMGATEEQATKYGLTIGTLEMGLEKLLGGMEGIYGKSVLGKTTNRVMTKVISNPILRKILTNASSEFTEEYLQEFLEPIVKNIILEEDNGADFWNSENLSEGIKRLSSQLFNGQNLYAGTLGAITSASMSTPAAISEKINYKNEVKSIKETISNQNVDQNITSLLNKGYDFETSVDIVNSALSEKGLQQIDKNILMENIKQPEKIQNSPIEQRNINNNINNQVNENVQNSMDTMQNNNIPENINNQQNNQLENLIEPQNINYSKNVNDRIDLEDYDFKTEQVIKSAERNVIVRNYRQLDTLIDEALDTQSNKALHFGRINETITQRIKRKLENLPKMKAPYLTKEKYDLVMNQSEIRHLIDEKTMMTREDVHKYVGVLPEIISNFDSASYSIEPDSEGIRFKKKLPDGNYISFVLVSNKQSTLKAKSIHLDKIDYETKKRSISPTNDVLKTPDRTSETDGAFASMKELAQARVQFPTSPNSLNEQVAPTGLLNNSASRFVEQPVSNNDNTTISPKSQIAPLPQYNMQQKTKNDTTKIKPPIAQEYQKNTIDEKIEKSDVPDVLKISGDNLIEQSSNLTNDDIAQILTEEPKTENTKNKRKLAILGAQLLDKGLVFENLSLKTKNRDLMGKWDYTLTSEARGQNVIGNGHYEFDSETKTKKQTSKSLYDIQKEVNNSGNTKEFYEYLYHKHNIDRMSLKDKYGIDNKPVFGDSIDAEYSRNVINEFEEKYPQFTDYAQDVYDYLNADRQELVKSGVITQELADYWQEMYPHYVPIRREDTFGNAIDVPLDTKRTSINAPIKKAKGGNQNILPLFDTIAKRTLQTYRAVAKNNFGIELKNTLNSSIDITDTNVDDIINNIDFQDELLTKGKNGSNPTFTVFENGKKVTFEITKDMYDALKPVSESSILSKTFKPFNKAMSIYRGILTEYNPVFMLTNSIKDAQDVLINSQHSLKTYKNIPEAYKQILSKGYWYQEYVSNGGEQNSYFDNWKNKFVKDEQNILGRIVKWPFKKVSQANNVIEMAPRLAEYIASRQEGRSIETSMLDAARVTTNFKAGGDTTKFLNRNGGIFLNASVQGLVQNVRNVREARANGLKGWTNLATKCIIAGIPALILNNMVWDDDDNYNELADYVKDNYYIIAKYGDGKFIRIPKGRTIAVIQNAFTQVADSTTGNDKADLDRFLNLATSNLAPNNPIENNIFSPIIQVLSNKTWYGDDLVPQRLQSSPNKQQYDETTDSFSKWLGNKLNISPYKIHYLLDQYSGGVGDVVLPMMTPKAENGSDSIGGKVISPLIDKFTTDSVMNNKYVGDFYDVKDKATQKAHSIDATEKDILMSKYLNSKNFYLNQLYAEKRAIQNSKLKDSKKYKKVREKQDEINKLAKQSIDEYKKVKINGSSATVGDITYRKDKNGEWTKVKDK